MQRTILTARLFRVARKNSARLVGRTAPASASPRVARSRASARRLQARLKRSCGPGRAGCEAWAPCMARSASLSASTPFAGSWGERRPVPLDRGRRHAAAAHNRGPRHALDTDRRPAGRRTQRQGSHPKSLRLGAMRGRLGAPRGENWATAHGWGLLRAGHASLRDDSLLHAPAASGLLDF